MVIKLSFKLWAWPDILKIPKPIFMKWSWHYNSCYSLYKYSSFINYKPIMQWDFQQKWVIFLICFNMLCVVCVYRVLLVRCRRSVRTRLNCWTVTLWIDPSTSWSPNSCSSSNTAAPRSGEEPHTHLSLIHCLCLIMLWTFSSSKQRPGDVGISFKQKLLFIENSLCVAAVIQVWLFAQHSRVYTFQGGGIHRGGDNLNKACKCSTGISPLPEFPQPWPHQHNSVMQMHRC